MLNVLNIRFEVIHLPAPICISCFLHKYRTLKSEKPKTYFCILPKSVVYFRTWRFESCPANHINYYVYILIFEKSSTDTTNHKIR